MNGHIIKNPIIPGFYPDPSICRVGDDFYLITSSFGIFPGIPVFKSRDLANWEQIDNALDRVGQHYVSGESFSGGVMAPTIRYHDGVFYIIVTNHSAGGNLIITATNPAGPWSDPVVLDDVPNIDASIFFDDDGKCYVHGLGSFDENGVMYRPGPDASMKDRYITGRGIWACEFDVKTMKTVGEKKLIWNSALRDAWAPEAPHIYRKGDWYYLIIAEGGTEHFHAVTVARSKDVLGFYHGFESNPVLTHRHLGYDYPIGNIGHADIVELKDGSWYAVILGSRIVDGSKNLGRETYICPVIWERDWPVFSPGTGKVEWKYPEAASLPWTPVEKEPELEHFDSSSLAPYWGFLGTPLEDFWGIRNSKLELRLMPRSIDRPLVPFWEIRTERVDLKTTLLSMLARRQIHFSFDFSVAMEFMPKADGEAAGIAMMQASNHMLYAEHTMLGGEKILRLVQVTTTSTGARFSKDFKSEQSKKVLAEIPWDRKKTILKISQSGQSVDFYYGEDENALVYLFKGADAREINPEAVGGMIGTMLGMYASSNGKKSGNVALFDWARYKGYEENFLQ